MTYPSTAHPRSAAAAGMLSLVVLLLNGCVTYHWGARSLFPADIETVFVPTFQSELFRPGVEQQLTEAVVKEIESRSHLKIAGPAQADSVLSGRIVQLRKRTIAEDAFDQSRVSELSFAIQVSWIDRDNRHRLQRAQIPIPDLIVGANQNVPLIPEAGQSFTTAQTRAIEHLASQIVGLMESCW